jgi:serine phosphatase RsbU (regulator of sigma subunit)
MLLVRLRGSRDFTADDVEQLRELGNRAALALDSARLYERERATARTLQSRLLPARLPKPRGIAAAAVYRAGGEGMHEGGDFYDLYPVPSGWVAVVGDVCGSGADAASLTSLLRHTLRTGSRLSRPEHALSLVDSAAREETGGRTFLTLAAAWLYDSKPGEPVRARIAVGGHPEPRLIHADGRVTRIPPNGPLLGVVDEWSIETTAIVIEPGETLLLFTDGLTEARNNGALYGDDRLDAVLSRLADAPLEELLRELEADVLDFAGGGTYDDLAMLALRPRRAEEGSDAARPAQPE